MKKRLAIFLTCMLFVGIQLSQAQTVRITGTVTSSEDGMPLPGVSVVIKGTTVGGATDVNGKYELTAPTTAQTLQVSYIGYVAQEIEIAGRAVIDVVMSPETKQIEEVVVVAYGTVKREAKTGSVSSVKGEGIAESPVTSVDKMLAGKMAGVQVTSASGQPGAESQIRVRGTSSINAGNEPLWVVDGIPVMGGNQSYFTNTGNAMSAVNPSDIESITVLKDAAAASVYGSRAANGVILVTTKSGKEGKAKFQVRSKVGFSQLANDNDFGVMNGQQLLGFQRQAAINAGYDPDSPLLASGSANPYYRPRTLLAGEQTNWMDHFTRLGKMQEYEINAAGGTDKSKFYTSLSYHRNEGIYYGVDFEKITGRVNSDFKLTKTLETGTRVNLAYTKANDIPMQSLYYSNPAFAGMTILPWSKKYNADGTHSIAIPENSNTNPRATAAYDDQWEKQFRLQGSFYLSYKPIEKVELKSNNAMEGTFGEGRRYWDPRARANKTTGTLQASTLQYVQVTTSNTASYNDVFAEDHYVRALVGQEAMKRTYKSYYIYSPDVDPQIPYPTTSTAEKDEGSYSENVRTLMSYFGIFDYNFASKYYLQASVRMDGSSLFGEDKRWGTFWSVGGSWNIHKEQFMEGISLIESLKLRASYGVNGNNNIDAYKAYGVYAASAYNGVTGMRPSRAANSKLSWEINKTWNAGIDFTLLKGRLNGSIDFYNRTTEDMLLDKQVPQTSGFSSNFMNIGSLENRGFEFQLDGEILKTNDLSWNAGLSLSFNRTELKDLGDTDVMTYSEDSRIKHAVGKRMFSYWVKDYYGVNPSNGDALWRKSDGTLTNDFNSAAYIYGGSPEPDFIGGFNTSVTWKGLTLSAFLEFKYGNEVLIIENRYIQADGNQMSMNQSKAALNYWKKPGDTGVNPKPVAGQATNSYNTASTRWVEDGSYCRIKDITLSYNVPQKYASMIKVSGLKVYVSALNIYTFHDVNFWDPERGADGMGYGIYPMTKTIVGGLELSF